MADISLEDSDCDALFITQTPKDSNDFVRDKSEDEDEVFGLNQPVFDLGYDLLNGSGEVDVPQKYSDISDVEEGERDGVSNEKEDWNSCSNMANEGVYSCQNGDRFGYKSIGVKGKQYSPRFIGVNKGRSTVSGRVGLSVSAPKRGMKRNFTISDESDVQDKKKLKYQKRPEAKIRWALKAYTDWRIFRMEQNECPEEIIRADLSDVDNLAKNDFEFTLCRFICEVKKVDSEEDYPGKTLYQIAVSLQAHLKMKGVYWKLVHGDDFQDFNRVLDNVMKDRCSKNLGNVVKRAEVISLEYEETLWKEGILGENSPDQLRDTVLYLVGVNIALHAGDEHYALRRPLCGFNSQISFETNSQGVKCMVIREDTCTKTNTGGLRHMRKEHKIVWVGPSDNPSRCPMRLTEKYVRLCPMVSKRQNFYLRSLEKPKINLWYSEVPVGINVLCDTVKRMLKKSSIDGYFTNHSLRRTCATRLFQAGQNTKLVKEVTGHVSNAVEKYEITSDQQRMEISKIIRGGNRVEVETGNVEEAKVGARCSSSNMSIEFTEKPEIKDTSVVLSDDEEDISLVKMHRCKCESERSDSADKICEAINRVVAKRKAKKTVIRIEFDLID